MHWNAITVKQREPFKSRKKNGSSDYSRDTERKVERLLSELYDALQIQKPEDLYGSIVIETRYQNGQPIGQVDVNIRYVLKRSVEDGSTGSR